MVSKLCSLRYVMLHIRDTGFLTQLPSCDVATIALLGPFVEVVSSHPHIKYWVMRDPPLKDRAAGAYTRPLLSST